jgi:hypothetical protein
VTERGTLVFERRNCWRLFEVDVLKVIDRFGADVRVSVVRGRMTCGVCKGRRGRALVG